jgi:hypothetical protein
MIHDDNEYHHLQQQFLTNPTISEHARATRIASQIDYNTASVSSDPLVKAKLLKRKQQADKLKPLIVHYPYEERFAYYKPKLHDKWNNLFHNTSVLQTELIVGTRNQVNLTKELVRRAPYPQRRTKTSSKSSFEYQTNITKFIH